MATETEIDDDKTDLDAEKNGGDLNEAMKTLRKQLAEEREARAIAERRAFEASRKEFSARGEVDEANIAMLENAIDVVKGNSQRLKENLAAAMANQDYSAVAEIQEAMAINVNRLGELELGKNKLANAPKKQPPAPEDPVEALAMRLTPRSADWVRKHPEYARNSSLYSKMVAAHNLVEADGISADTDEYFSEIEHALKITPSRASIEDDGEDSPFSDAGSGKGGRNAAPAAAPVGRTMSYSQTGSTPRASDRVRLTAEQVDAARAAGITEQEYYKNLVQLRREGRLN
jgi:hypothetical protein